MTLDAAEIDLSKTFETGQGYVALSRIRNIEGLRLMGLNTMALRVDPLILHVDERIKQASQKAAETIEALSEDNLGKMFDSHISQLGGIVSKEKIAEERQNIKEGKPSRSVYVTPTHIKTKHLIKKSDTLMKLAQNRGLSKGTVVQHLARIKEEEPNIDINKYKPSGEAFEKVWDAVLKLQTKKFKDDFTEEGKLKLRSVFDALGGDVSYDDIKVCMLFME
jgi:DNA-binding CsgD family transcriptional regulator